MADHEMIDVTKERNNYLASIQGLKFSKDGKDVFEAIDIERRSLVLKYLTARMFDSPETALTLLQKGLEDYQNLMDDKNGVNNYWRQFKVQCCNITNDPLQWKSSLTDPNTALEYIKPFPCQTDKTLPCRNKSVTDGQIENIIHTWKDVGAMTRKRKVTNKTIVEENSKNIEPELVEDVMSIKNDAHLCQNSYNINKVMHQQFISPSTSNNPPVINTLSKLSNDNYSNIARDRYSRLNPQKSASTLRPPVNNSPEQEAPDLPKNKVNPFKTAYELKKEQQASKGNRPVQKKTLGGRSAVNAPFVCPLKRTQEGNNETRGGTEDNNSLPEEMSDERMKNIDPKMVELIKNEIMDCGTPISWDDIAGLDFAKKIIKEVVVFPMLRPDIFTGLRRPPKGILLFGPPGTGKTLIGKCIASQSKSTFFSISASSLTSKWVGEGEKMVRALFAVARVHQPSVIFIDEIDSLLTQRSETEHESSRRIKTEFLVQLDGAATSEDDRILIVGATNRPQELDEAARRRLVKRLYVPLPELEARRQIVNNLLTSIPHSLTQEQILEIAIQAAGYSGADMTNLCKEASMGPIRSIPFSQLENVRKEDVRKVTGADFAEALANVRPSVSQSDLSIYVEWDNTYGSGTARNPTR